MTPKRAKKSKLPPGHAKKGAAYFELEKESVQVG